MIGGDYSEFLDHLYYGDEFWIKYKGVVYFIEGWYEDSKCTIQCSLVTKQSLKLLYEISSKSMQDCAKKLLAQPLFEGKTLPEIEQETEWVDTELG